MRKLIYILTVFITFYACKKESTPNAQEIINKTIAVAGGEKYNNFKLEFDFRNIHYSSKRKGGAFEYTRIIKDSLRDLVDVYSNTSAFKRFDRGETVVIPDSISKRIENSINSVNYFVLLPLGLNDAAVNKTYLNETTIKEKKYHKIKVMFSQDGGGKDFEDVYVYWINKETYKIDYLAYSYIVNGGGMRFREAYNERYIGGLRFVDYNNYKPKDKDVDLFNLDELFQNNGLKLLSKIETKNIELKDY